MLIGLTIAALVAAVAAVTVAVVYIIKFLKVKEELRKLKILRQAQERVALLLNGNNYQVISGVFDNSTGKLEQAGVMESSQIDEETRQYLPENEIVEGF